MADHHLIDIQKLEKRVTALSDALAHLSSPNDFRQLIQIMKRPGWTTPAELIFTVGIVESMLAQTEALTRLKGDLLRGSEAVIAKEDSQSNR
jgi:hypothetical protein